MIGLRAGVRAGIRVGIASGISEDPLSVLTVPLVGVTRDASSGVYCPATVAEWQVVYTAAGLNLSNTPTGIWPMQESSGNMVDAVAGVFTLTASGTGLAYQQTEPGWSRKAITTTDNGTGVFSTTTAVLNDIAVGSQAVLVYARSSAGAAKRAISGLGLSATRCSAETAATTGFASFTCGASTLDGVAALPGRVQPWLVRINRSGLTNELMTDIEKLAPAFGVAAAGKQITVGALASNTAATRYVYGALFLGNAAEMTVAQYRAMLVTLGWSVAW